MYLFEIWHIHISQTPFYYIIQKVFTFMVANIIGKLHFDCTRRSNRKANESIGHTFIALYKWRIAITVKLDGQPVLRRLVLDAGMRCDRHRPRWTIQRCNLQQCPIRIYTHTLACIQYSVYDRNTPNLLIDTTT